MAPRSEPLGPNGMALELEARIAELEAAKGDCRTRTARRTINKRLFAMRGLLRWCKTRAGYRETPRDLEQLN